MRSTSFYVIGIQLPYRLLDKQNVTNVIKLVLDDRCQMSDSFSLMIIIKLDLYQEYYSVVVDCLICSRMVCCKRSSNYII